MLKQRFVGRTRGMEKRVNLARLALMEAQSKSESNPGDIGLCEEERRLAIDFRKLKYNQFLFNKQRTNAQWIKEGDTNTKFFHSLLKKRRFRNNITQIFLGDGSVSTDSKIIRQEFSKYFKELLGQAKSCNSTEFGEVVQGPTISGEQCRYNALPKGVNAAYIAVVPKNRHACKPEDYRLIFCCNVTYKIVATLLARRLKDVLPDIINSAQGAFVKDRSIVNNICLAQQLLSGYGRKNLSERMACKIDLRKAYNTIGWRMLQRLNRNEGFYYHPKCHRITLSHIMFADDLILFSSGRSSAVKAIKDVVNDTCARFLWRGCGGKKGDHQVKWEDVYRDKEEGGLGFKNIEVLRFLHVVPPDCNWESLIPWFNGLTQERLRTKMIAAATTRVMYGVWKARNMKIFQEENISPAQIVQESIWYLKMKLGAINTDACACAEADLIWLQQMKILN
ncbi:hypothetical protein QQ045_012698 [Rhodiola kirilowii]